MEQLAWHHEQRERGKMPTRQGTAGADPMPLDCGQEAQKTESGAPKEGGQNEGKESSEQEGLEGLQEKRRAQGRRRFCGRRKLGRS